jgi:hypothetical protein
MSRTRTHRRAALAAVAALTIAAAGCGSTNGESSRAAGAAARATGTLTLTVTNLATGRAITTDGQIISPTTPLRVAWTSTGVGSFDIQLLQGGALVETLAPGVAAGSGGSWDWTVPGTRSGAGYQLRLVATVAEELDPVLSPTFVIPQLTQLTMVPSTLTSVEDLPVTFTATVTSGGAPVAGLPVIFLGQGWAMGAVVTDASGVATFTTRQLSSGVNFVRAYTDGTATYSYASSPTYEVRATAPTGSAATAMAATAAAAVYGVPGLPVAVDPGLTLTSDAAIYSTRVFVSSGYLAAEDVLALPAYPGIGSSWDA